MVVGFIIVMVLAIGFAIGYNFASRQHLLIYRRSGLPNAIVLIGKDGLCGLMVAGEIECWEEPLEVIVARLRLSGY
jgi:hypothetical protein